MNIIIEITATKEQLTDGLDRLFQDDIDFREHVLTAIRRVARLETAMKSGVLKEMIMVEAEIVNEPPDPPPDEASVKARWGVKVIR